ncbi:hypothetical protein [Sphingobacterium psychroaquaticum]|uniref:Uncharacterized protein n=1 Tax=Sphingobacterium psychroaquaticum TaxID=561061 RepID=A0A1X7JW78_9SPHI|nr:hypothetical protein [Sphingobacterium psychroaquaticum]SMG32751.1 hypothetical protein SAMN05660862_2284 [Sphingobacterium psychroaquaticum]
MPLDWNPQDPNGYSEWMKSIVQQNKENERSIPKNQLATSSGFITPEPRFIGDIIIDSIYPITIGTNKALQDAREILYGGNTC